MKARSCLNTEEITTWPLRVLGHEIELSGSAELLLPLATAYARFRSDPTAAPARIRLDNDGISVDGERFPMLPGITPTLQVYQHYLNLLLDRIDSHLIVHAAALASERGDAFLLAGPSGHGKTSQTLELAHRGHRFLSDDYSPLHVEDRTITPFPRTVGVLPGGSARIPRPFAEAAKDTSAVRLFGKALLDVGQVLGEATIAREPLPLRHVVLLAGSDRDRGRVPATTGLDLACREAAAERLDTRIRAIDGVEVLESKDANGLRFWRLRVHHERRPTRPLSEILHDEAVVFCEKSWESLPDFGAKPEATEISRREAAEALGRELQNRRASGALMRGYGGDLSAMFLDLARGLSEATCWRVTVGRYDETTDLIQRLVND